jgi:hypothetical protein
MTYLFFSKHFLADFAYILGQTTNDMKRDDLATEEIERDDPSDSGSR